MNKSVWIGIATAIGLGEYARYGRMMDSISVKASNVKFSAQGTLMSISFSLEISNKSNKSVNIRSLNGKLYVGKLFIGNFRSIQSTTIKPNTVSTLPITATINAQEVLNNAVGKDFQNAEIIIDTNTIVDFNLLSLISVPIPIRDTTTINTSELFREFSSLVMNFKNLFNL